MWRIIYLFRCLFVLLITPLYLMAPRGRSRLKVMPPYSWFKGKSMGKVSMFVEFRHGKLDNKTRDILDSGIYFVATGGTWGAFIYQYWEPRWDDWGDANKVYGAQLKDGYFVSQNNWDGEIWKLFKERHGAT